MHPDDREPVMEAATACLKGKTPEYMFEHRMMHRDGSIRWVDVHGSVIRDAQGNAIRMFGTDTDITERKQAEEALKESERKYRELYDEAPVGYHEIDTNGRITRVNQTEANLLGYTPEEIVGKYVWEFMPGDQQELSKKSVQEKIEQKKALEGFERKIVCKDKQQIDVYMVDRLIQDRDGKVSAFALQCKTSPSARRPRRRFN